MDESGTATLSDAMKASFEPFDSSLTKGYTASAAWLRLRIPGRASAEPLALIVRPPYLRRIEFHDPSFAARPSAAAPIVSGRDAPVQSSNHIGLNNGFVIPASTTPRDV